MSMEEGNRLTHHNVPTWNPTKPTPNTSSSSPLLHQNKEACKEQGHNGNDDNSDEEVMTGREKLKRHREEVKGQVNIPEDWGQERLLKDWADCTTFDDLLGPHRLIVSARDALAAEARKSAAAARSQRLRIHTRC